MSFLLDTNAVSEIRRGRDQWVRAWVSEVADADLHLSVLTLGEIRKGIELLRDRDPAQAEVFASWLNELRTRFADRIVPIDDRVAEEWGRLNAAAPRNTIDGLIAATARIRGLTVVTRNTDDFEGCGVPLLNPWHHQPDVPD
ncbi:MAG: type II toxin-antitoxin system VapC family toxin [Solirubrobacteraceae bacterium]